MKLALAYFEERHFAKMPLSRQMGVDFAVTNLDLNRSDRASLRTWESAYLQALLKRYEDQGLRVCAIEGPTPLDKVKLGLPGRDEEIAHFLEMMENLARLGVDTVCYNWMPVLGWVRTSSDARTRGEARVTAFDYDRIEGAPFTDAGRVTGETLWRNLAYFLEAVVPAAERWGLKLALHPDDPPVPCLRGIDRILVRCDDLRRAVDLVPSDASGIALCQGSLAAMGEDIPAAIRDFGRRRKIFFVHFRDIRGHRFSFQETFHDDGMTDMHEAMKCLYEVGFDGPIRPDHVPTMAGEDVDRPGYGILGNLFAIGYMKGLMEAVEKSQRTSI